MPRHLRFGRGWSGGVNGASPFIHDGIMEDLELGFTLEPLFA